MCFHSEMPLPFSSAGQPDKPVFSSSKETSSIVIEKKDEITASLGGSTPSNSSRQHMTTDSNSRSMHDAAVEPATAGTSGGVQSAGADAAVAAVKTTSTIQVVQISHCMSWIRLTP